MENQENLLVRKDYLETLMRFKDKQLIKVVTGIRRCGKSTLFDLFIITWNQMEFPKKIL